MARKRRDKAGGRRSDDALDSAVPIRNEGVGNRAWQVAERSRPRLPDENADGLNPLEEAVRHMAEDVPLAPLHNDDPVLPFGSEDKPIIEPREIVENEGDLPGLTDQGENAVEKEEPPVPRRK
jgi:hypothetical protein